MIDMPMPNLGRRRCVTGADAGRAHHAHPGQLLALQGAQQLLGAGKCAAQAVAHAHRHGFGGRSSPAPTTSKWA